MGQLSLCVTTTEAHVPRAFVLHWEKPPQWEAHTSQLGRTVSTHRKKKKPTCNNEDPAQPKINKENFIKKQTRKTKIEPFFPAT